MDAEVTVDGPVNTGHISELLGGITVKAKVDDDESTVWADVDEQTLADAIAAHNPDWVDPDAVPVVTVADRLGALEGRVDALETSLL